MFITLRNRVTVTEGKNIFTTTVVSGKNAYTVINKKIADKFTDDLNSLRYCVIRSIFERTNLDGFKEYHCYDRHGDHFVIVDLSNAERDHHKLVRWIDLIDCAIRAEENRQLKEIRVYTNQHNVDDYLILDLDEEQVAFHTEMKAHTLRYFN